MDSLEKVVLDYLDSLTISTDQLKKDLLKDDPKYPVNEFSDIRKIKKIFIESQAVYRNYVDIEMDIIGEFYGMGRERNIGVNLGGMVLIDERIEEMKRMLKW